MKLAVERELIVKDPTAGCALPKVKKKEMRTLPLEQLISFLWKARESGVFELHYLDLAIGLRRDELLGLKWADIDLEMGERQAARIEGEIVEAPRKTKESHRFPIGKR